MIDMTETTMPLHPDARYWVGSDTEEPLRICMTHEDARCSGFRYIDAFDINGNRLEAYKMVDNHYTTKF